MSSTISFSSLTRVSGFTSEFLWMTLAADVRVAWMIQKPQGHVDDIETGVLPLTNPLRDLLTVFFWWSCILQAFRTNLFSNI